MISHLSISGFKRFQHAEMSLSKLTVLAGMNGAGKTSTIHALLLLRQACLDADRTVPLNGPFGMQLGTYDSIRNWDASDLVSITVLDDLEVSHSWRFHADADDLFVAAEYFGDAPPRALGLVGRHFQYLCAERVGPRTAQDISSAPPYELSVGTLGEHSAQVLYELGGQPVDVARRSPSSGDRDAHLVKVEVEKWLSHLLVPIQLDSELTKSIGSASLRFRTGSTGWVAPPNMGFGVTYCLPIVLAALTAERDGMLVVENPEAHLHPAAQSKMGGFLAAIASSGVQVIVETHSDHILNGIRRAVGDGTISSDQAIVQYFDHNNGDGPMELKFTATGGISDWPPGFFDQYQIDVAAISRTRRAR